MLTRIGGGHGGIKEYLEEGIKNGRDHTRDELDSRVVLAGDLSVANEVILAMEATGQRYLHVTLSFKEDAIDAPTLHAISDEFKTFAMSAYREDEYTYYAEAHLPKIKSYLDKTTGENIDRKPHIHIVIPEINIDTGKRLDPFGKVELQTKYINAFQEVMNEKYGFASPKIHIRRDFSDESTILARSKGNIFKGANKTLKTQIFNDSIKNKPTSLTEFSRQLKEQGYVVTERNLGKENNYLNVKIPGQAKGINLKETVFSARFLSLSPEQQQAALDPDRNHYISAHSDNYLASKEDHHLLATWHQQRAEEVRYVHRRNRSKYQIMSNTEKSEFLTTKRNDNDVRLDTRTIADNFNDIDNNLRAAVRYLQHAKRDCHGIKSGGRNLANRRAIRDVRAAVQRHSKNQRSPPPIRERKHRSNLLTQCISDNNEHDNGLILTPSVKNIKQHLDAAQLLTRLSHSHGVIAAKYRITKASDGSDRIVCGKQLLNVTDFLTKEMAMSWKEAKPLLESAYRAQLQPSLSESTRHGFNAWQPTFQKERKRAWQMQYGNESAMRKENNLICQIAKKAIYDDPSLSKVDRHIALSISNMNKVLADMRYKQERTLAREELTLNYPNTSAEQYAQYEERQSITESTQMNKEHTGIITRHGSAPYQNNPENKQSYFLELQTSTGQMKIIWGLALEKAVRESNSAVGDNVVLSNKNTDLDKAKNKKTRIEWKIEKYNQAVAIEETKIKKGTNQEKKITPTTKKTIGNEGKEKTAPLTINEHKLNSNLEASRLLVNFPHLEKIGIELKHISPTPNGDTIEYKGQALSAIPLMQETHNISAAEAINYLTPVYEAQLRDAVRVQEYMEKETNKKEDIENENVNVQPQDKTKQCSPLPPKYYDNVKHNINKNGHVEYYLADQKIVVDRGNDVHITRNTDPAIEIGLRLSIEKFGRLLDVQGTPEYKEKIIEVAVRHGLDITFVDPKMNDMMTEKHAQFNNGLNIIKQAEHRFLNASQATSKQEKTQAQPEQSAQVNSRSR